MKKTTIPVKRIILNYVVFRLGNDAGVVLKTHDFEVDCRQWAIDNLAIWHNPQTYSRTWREMRTDLLSLPFAVVELQGKKESSWQIISKEASLGAS